MLHFHRKFLLFAGLLFSFLMPVIARSQTVNDSIAPATDLSLPFAAVAIDKQSALETITLSNPLTTGVVTISQIQITGSGSGDFLLDVTGGPNPCGSISPTTIPAGQSCTLTVRFVPKGAGARTAFLNFSLGSQKIAFHNTTSTGISLYDLPTRVITNLTTPGNGVIDSQPNWAPSGGMIVFKRTDPSAVFEETLMTLATNGSASPTLLLENAESPAWSPDGKKIAFRNNEFGSIQVFDLISSKRESSFGSTGSGGLRDPSWSMNGNELTFNRSKIISGAEIVKVELIFDAASGAFINSGPETILSPNGNTPAWSPDGQNIAFHNTLTGEINMVDPNGGLVSMTTHPIGKSPSWSPDSRQLVFHRASGFGDEIIIINADGTGEQIISSNGKTPAWSPDGKQVFLSGTGLAAGTNSPPSAPQLVDPKDKQPGLGPSVTLSWLPSTDPEGDAIHYEYTVCETADFVGCPPKVTQLAQSEQKGLMFAGIGFIFFGIALIAGKRKGKTAGALLLMMIIAAPLLFSACGGGGSSSNNPENNNGNDSATNNQAITQVVSNLNTNTTYYWQITAIDTSDAETKSVVRQFST